MLAQVLICLLALCSSTGKLATKLHFQKFIYPYSIFVYQPYNSSFRSLHFEKITSGLLYSNLTESDRVHLQKYSHLESFTMPGNNMSSFQMVVKENLFIVKNVHAEVTWSIAYLKRPHLHKYHVSNSNVKQLDSYVSFFQQREQTIKFHGTYLFDACQLWRSWVFVRLQQTPEEFQIVLRREPGHKLVKKHALLKDYFTQGDVKILLLEKQLNNVALNLFVASHKKVCAFGVTGDLSLTPKYCLDKQDYILEALIVNQNKLVIFYSDIPEGHLVRFEVQDADQAVSICKITLPFLQTGPYTVRKYIHNRIVVCAVSECHSYSLKCQSISGIQQLINPITDIHYQRIEHDFLQYVYSAITIESNNRTILLAECDTPSLFMSDINMCRKGESASNPKLVAHYSSLDCYACSRSPRGYFSNDTCQYLPDKQVELFPDDIYLQKSLFIQKYAEYSSGITSKCNSTLDCSFQEGIINSLVSVNQSDGTPPGSWCSLLLEVDSSRVDFMMEYTSMNEFGVQICSAEATETALTCVVKNMTSPEELTTSSNDYLLFIITSRSSGTNTGDFSITNLEQQTIHRTSLVFSHIVLGFIVIVLCTIVWMAVRGCILRRLALMGWIRFVPSGVYPLSSLELHLKIISLTSQGYLRFYSHSTSQANKHTLEQQECCFCLNGFQEGQPMTQIYCRHQFHQDCLSQWFQLQMNSNKCPVCKREFTLGDLQKFNTDMLESGLQDSGLQDSENTSQIGLVID